MEPKLTLKMSSPFVLAVVPRTLGSDKTALRLLAWTDGKSGTKGLTNIDLFFS